MFGRFTESARQVVVLAQDEARSLKHNYIGTEHILLGLLRQDVGIVARAVSSLDVSLEDIRAEVAKIIGLGDERTTGQIPFTPRAKKILELALRQALSLGHNYIGPEHILLALAHENEGVAARILWDRGISARQLANSVFAEMGQKMDALTFSDQAPSPGPPFAAARGIRVEWRQRRSVQALAGWLLFAISLGIGILIGWAIWG